LCEGTLTINRSGCGGADGGRRVGLVGRVGGAMDVELVEALAPSKSIWRRGHGVRVDDFLWDSRGNPEVLEEVDATVPDVVDGFCFLGVGEVMGDGVGVGMDVGAGDEKQLGGVRGGGVQ